MFSHTQLALARAELNTATHCSSPWLGDGRLMSQNQQEASRCGDLVKLRVTNRIGAPECDRQSVCPVAFQVLPSLNKSFHPVFFPLVVEFQSYKKDENPENKVSRVWQPCIIIPAASAAFCFVMDVWSTMCQRARGLHVISAVWREALNHNCRHCSWRLWRLSVYVSVTSQSRCTLTPASVILILSCRHDLCAGGYGASPIHSIWCRHLGRCFWIIEQAELEMPQGSFRRESDYPWGLFGVLDLALGEKNWRTGWINEHSFNAI